MNFKSLHKFVTILGLSTLASCSSSHGRFEKTVSHLEIERFMGTWYVQAGRFTMFEREVHNSIEVYHWNEQRERVDIEFQYNRGSLDGPLVNIPQSGRIFNQETNAHWKVSPFWPLEFDFLVIALADDYSWTAIGVPNQNYLWIMTRVSQVTKEDLSMMIQKVKDKGYHTGDLTYVEHR